MNNLCVTLWGTTIGYLHYEAFYPYITFEYDSHFALSGIELSPIMMKVKLCEVYNFPFLTDEPFYNLPGLFSFSLPKGFSALVFKAFLSQNKIKEKDLNPLSVLSFISDKGLGGFSYGKGNEEEIDEEIDITSLSSLSFEVRDAKDKFTLLNSKTLLFNILCQNTRGIGGDTAKLLCSYNNEKGTLRSGLTKIQEGFTPSLIKMDPSTRGIRDLKQETRIEYVYYMMAKDCGINVSSFYLLEKDGYTHFVTTRFDRTIENKKLHMQNLSSLIHKSGVDKYDCDYEKACDIMREMNVYERDIKDFYRRLIFNVLMCNEDDSINNISFLMDKTGCWSLSPFYDITFYKNYKDGHKMAINNKFQNINNIDLLLCGKHMGLKDKECTKILKEVGEVVKNFHYYAHEYNLNQYNIDRIQKAIKEIQQDIWY